MRPATDLRDEFTMEHSIEMQVDSHLLPNPSQVYMTSENIGSNALITNDYKEPIVLTENKDLYKWEFNHKN